MSNQALNGNLGLIWHPGKNWQVNAHISTGFRSPNIDDVSRVFDSEPGNVVVPNPELEPEYARNYELNISKNFAGKARFEIAFYYSKLKNAMVRRDFSLNGQDSMMYDGTMSKIEALVNTESATIWGSDLNFEYIISGSIRNRTNFTLTRGKDAEGFPVRHVPPTFGSSHLIFERQKIFIDLYANFSGKLDYDELAPDEQDKPNLYLPDENGNPYSPAWWTINLKSSYAFSQNFTFTAGVENITDKRYRSYSSGIVSPGINFTGSVVYRF
jgi:hemoglobin/transferrin/lactoferrin receptor protein